MHISKHLKGCSGFSVHENNSIILWMLGKMTTDFHKYSTCVHLHLPVSTNVHLHPISSTWIHLYAPASTFVHLCPPVSTCIHFRPPVYTCIHFFMNSQYYLISMKSLLFRHASVSSSKIKNTSLSWSAILWLLEGIVVPCNLCDKTFRSINGFRQHKRLHQKYWFRHPLQQCFQVQKCFETPQQTEMF